MAQPKRVTYFKAKITDTPGTLLGIAQTLKARKIGLVALWGYSTQPGGAELYCIPKDVEMFRSFAKASGMAIWEATGFLLKGTDRTGALVSTLDVLAKAGINIVALHAMAAAGNYGAFLHVSDADVDKTAAAIGAR